jgi:7,8-dihydropterin-6-yl-methyl-4-(beta-D-ribofuranosyl)aminobenzene 5'-phosphate synthase
MNNKMTVIVDNTPNNGIKGEWGLSILVEHDGRNILVDAGASDLFVENMKALGKRITDVDYGVLSHAHYDHANGIPRFFMENKKAKFYLRETTAENCYAKI